MCLSHRGLSYKMPLWYKSGCCIHGKWCVQLPRAIPLLKTSWFSKISSSTNVRSWYVQTTSAILHHLLAHCAHLLLHHCTGDEFQWRKCFSHKSESYCILCKMKFPVLPLHISLSPEYLLSDNLVLSVACYPYFRCSLLQKKMKWLTQKLQDRAQIPNVRSPWWWNFVQWCLVFVDPQYGTCFVSPAWHLEFGGRS